MGEPRGIGGIGREWVMIVMESSFLDMLSLRHISVQVKCSIDCWIYESTVQESSSNWKYKLLSSEIHILLHLIL